MGREVKTIAVIGAGDMGHGIAELAAIKGFNVRLRDVKQEYVDRAMEKIRWSLAKLAEHKTITNEVAKQALGRIQGTTNLTAAVTGAEIVIEAVPEDLDLKQRVFAEIETLAHAETVFATNTSAIRVTEIASKLKRPERMVGMHFFNPVLLMDLVEVIPGEKSAASAVETVVEVSKKLGKTTVVLKKDTPGFVTSRLIGVWVGAAILLYERKKASAEAIDSSLKFRAGFPMGPFELADYTGLDVGHHAAAYIESRLGPAYRPARSLADLVQKKQLGKKTGRGYYEWKDNRITTKLSQETGKDFDPSLVLAIVANEAARLLETGVATASEIDLAMRNGCAFPKGPLEWADEVGLDQVLKTLVTLREEDAEPLLTPAPLLEELVHKGRLGRKTSGGFYETAASPASLRSAGSAYENLLVNDSDKGVRTITLNRPHRLNALNETLMRELADALRAAGREESVRVVVITGSTDKAFCVGADLQDSAGVTPALMVEASRLAHAAFAEIEGCPKPVVAAINGYAYGGGLELALACDFRVAAKRAKLGLTEVTLGLLPAAGGTQRLPRLVGLARAKEIVLFGEKHDAERALEWGLLHRVYDNAEFSAKTREFAEKLAALAPLALRYAKACLNAAPTADFQSGVAMESAAFGVLSGSEDALEGVSAMFGKRAPEFKGR